MKIVRIGEVGLEHAAQEAAWVLSEGGIVLYPTETVYGLGVNATNTQALRGLYHLKNRDLHKTALIAVGSSAEIEHYGVMNTTAHALAKRFLPGPLTLVLPATERVLEGVIRDDGTVGVRVPSDAFCVTLARQFKGAYTSTSANISTLPPAGSVQDILAQFGESASAISLVIDDGERSKGTPSTIVSCVTETPVILREGALSREELGL